MCTYIMGSHSVYVKSYRFKILISSLKTIGRIYLKKHTYSYQWQGGKREKNEMGGACGAYGGGERCAQGSVWET